MHTPGRKQGFTIIEILIAVVVIGVLATITAVGYNGIQQRARDTARKDTISVIAKQLNIYYLKTPGYMADSGCGGGTGGDAHGWFNYDYDAGGALRSVAQCLINAGITNKISIDPSGLQTCAGATCRAYMIATCTATSPPTIYLMANLETLPQSSTATDSTCVTTWDTSYGINYVVKVR